MSIIELKNLAKSYGNKTVLRDINLSVNAGEFMVVFGLPVSGKSVLVRLLSGLEKPDKGSVFIRGKDMTTSAPGDRNLGYVPQSFALYPHFSVFDNIAYSLSLIRVPKQKIKEEVRRAAALLKIEQFLDRKPDQLSGGQKQRVAIARGLVKQTDLFILDDPLVGLDFKLRERLIDDLKQTQEQLKVTFVYTTSEAIEATQLATQIAVMEEGRIVEVGTPESLYTKPNHAATMRYVGFPQANFLQGTVSQHNGSSHLSTSLFDSAVTQSSHAQTHAVSGTVSVGVRPEHVLIGEPPAGMLAFKAKVLLREDLGGEEIVYLDAGGTQITSMLRSTDADMLDIALDQVVTCYIPPQEVVVYAHGKYVGRAS